MATIGATNPTLIDVCKAMNPDGSVAQDIAELLTQQNEILMDMTWMEANLPTGHQAVVRTALPTAVFRKYYGGTAPQKTSRAQITDSIGMIESRNEIDKDLADLNGNANAFRLSEAVGIMEGMNQTFAAALLFGDTTLNPEKILGFQPRYASSTGGSGQNVILAGGAGADNTSMYLVAWGPQTVTGIYPKGSTAGLQRTDLGVIDAFDASQNRFRAYADLFQWKCGLHVKDWRYVVRIANIDISDIQGQTGTQTLTSATNILNCMIRAKHKLPTMNLGRPVFYCNRTIRAALDWMALNKSNAALSISEAAGQITTSFLGIPIRTMDQLLNTETVVV